MKVFKDYLHLVRTYPRYLTFGVLHLFYSSPSQSFSVAIFVPSLTVAFDLSAGGFGLLSSCATLASALLLPLLGPLMDRHNMRIFSICVGVGLVIGCMVSAAATVIPLLFAGLLILRLFSPLIFSLTGFRQPIITTL